jgi:hypothetical protein
MQTNLLKKKVERAMKPQFDIDRYFELMKSITEIEVDKTWEASIKFHILNAKNMAEICESAELEPDTIDFSNTFNPGYQ